MDFFTFSSMLTAKPLGRLWSIRGSGSACRRQRRRAAPWKNTGYDRQATDACRGGHSDRSRRPCRRCVSWTGHRGAPARDYSQWRSLCQQRGPQSRSSSRGMLRAIFTTPAANATFRSNNFEAGLPKAWRSSCRTPKRASMLRASYWPDRKRDQACTSRVRVIGERKRAGLIRLTPPRRRASRSSSAARRSRRSRPCRSSPRRPSGPRRTGRCAAISASRSAVP